MTVRSPSNNSFRYIYLSLLTAICGTTAGLGIYFHQDIARALQTNPQNLRAELLDVQNKWGQVQEEVMSKYLPQKISAELLRSALHKILPTEFDRNQLLANLESMSLKNESNINRVTFAKENPETKYRTLTFAIELSGSRQSLLSFLKEIENRDHGATLPFINITDVAINHDEITGLVPLLATGGDDESTRWTMEIQAATYAQWK